MALLQQMTGKEDKCIELMFLSPKKLTKLLFTKFSF